MTTRDKGITLPDLADYTNSATSAGYKVTDTANDYTVKHAWNFGAGYSIPLNVTATGAEDPVDFTITGQNASASQAHVGGAIHLTPGQGSVANASGNVVIKDTNGDGAAYNTSHIELGAYHLWIDSSDRLRIKSSAPSSATDGMVVGYDLVGSATYDPPNLVDGAGVTTTVGVAGAVLGDFTLASFSLDLQGITVTSYVSAANVVSVRFQNESGGALDLASGTLKVRVIKQ